MPLLPILFKYGKRNNKEKNAIFIKSFLFLGTKIKVNKVTYNDCVKQLEELATLTLQDYSGEYIIIDDVDIGNYELEIYDITTQVLKGTKEVFIFLSSEATELNWCVVEYNEPIWYNIYTKVNPEDNYTSDNVVNVGNTLTYNLNNLGKEDKWVTECKGCYEYTCPF